MAVYIEEKKIGLYAVIMINYFKGPGVFSVLQYCPTSGMILYKKVNSKGLFWNDRNLVS